MEDYGFDGLDVDYEYPAYPNQANGFCDLVKELRTALDLYAQKKGIQNKILLTVCHFLIVIIVFPSDHVTDSSAMWPNPL